MENCPSNDMMISSNEICTYIGAKRSTPSLLKGATTSIVVRGSAYRHELQALFGTFHKKSYLAQYQTHFSLQSLDQMYEPPQSNVQSNIWMEKNYEHTDPYQSSTNVKRSANDWKT